MRQTADHVTTAALPARLRDERGGAVVLLSHCLLNEHTRFLGGACRPGCVAEVVEQCVAAGLGIVQLPCPEEAVWGGVQKRHLLRLYGVSARWPILRPLMPAVVACGGWYTTWRYRRLAAHVARQVADYQRAGYRVRALVGVDGSPSCGVTRTIANGALVALAATPRDRLSVATIWPLLARYQQPGSGRFIAALRREWARRGLEAPFTAHDLFGERAGARSTVRLCD